MTAPIPSLSEYIKRKAGTCCPRCGHWYSSPPRTRAASKGTILSGQPDSPCAFIFCGADAGCIHVCAYLYVISWETDFRREPTPAEKAWLMADPSRREYIRRRTEEIIKREGLFG